MMKLGAFMCVVQQSHSSSNLGSKVKGQGHQAQKNEKVRQFSEAVLGGASCVVRQLYAGGKISACCPVLHIIIM